MIRYSNVCRVRGLSDGSVNAREIFVFFESRKGVSRWACVFSMSRYFFFDIFGF